MVDVRRLKTRHIAAAATGLVAAGSALGIGELVAAFSRPAAAPVIAVGNRFITLTPEPVKQFAIRNFGTDDKPVLLTGIYVVLSVVAVAVGLLVLRGRWWGICGVATIGAVGIYCALTANASRTSDLVPALIGSLAGMVVLWRLADLINRPDFDDGHTAKVSDAPPESTSTATSTKPNTSRRRFLLVSTASALAAAALGIIGRSLQRARFDAGSARAAVTLPPVTDSTAAGASASPYELGKSDTPFQTPNSQFYRIDTALAVPQVNPATWRLRIHGLVDRELTLTYDQLLARPQVQRWITMACVSNEVGDKLIGNAQFQGTLLADLLREVGVSAKADQLLATSIDGMTIGSPVKAIMDGRDAMLAVGMNGQPLPIEHGFPVRMVVPGLYGYVSACKWITDINLSTFATNQAYWVQEGWSELGPIVLSSRIDVPRSSAVVPVGQLTTIAGVAWDQHVGVSKVEVQIGKGDWVPARLAPVPSVDTWRQWVLPWTFASAGETTVSVRAYGSAGTLQDDRKRPPYPGAATGLHSITVRAR